MLEPDQTLLGRLYDICVRLIEFWSLIRSISLFVQVMNLSENEMDVIAKFMGHDIKIHRKNYRLPDQALQLGKVTRVLLALEVGKVKDLSGQNLINFSTSSPGNSSEKITKISSKGNICSFENKQCVPIVAQIIFLHLTCSLSLILFSKHEHSL